VAVALVRQGIDGSEQLLALVFLTIACTVFLAGFTAGPVATLLGQRMPGRDGVAILGVGGLGLLLAAELRRADISVVFLDSNPQSCRRAEEEGFTVVYGNALQERTLLRARMGGIGSVVGLTANQMLNSVFVSRTRDRFGVPKGYVAVQRLETGLAPELVQAGEAHVLFDGAHDVEGWDVLQRHASVDVERWVFVSAPEAQGEASVPPDPAGGGDRFVMLCVQRGKSTGLMHGGMGFKAGDVAVVAVHRDERESAHESLRALGFEPEPEEPPEAVESGA
jgi:hypothetical protein